MQEQDESLILHLEALRTMLIKCFVALGVGLLPMFLAAPYGMNGLIKIIIGNNNVSLNYFSPMEVFILQIKIAVVFGFTDLFSLYCASDMEIFAPGALRQRTQVYKIDCFRFFRSLHHRRSVLHLFYPAADYQFRHQFCHAGH